MKKILTVTSVILLFACLTQGFTTPGHSTFTTTNTIAKNESKAGNAPRFFRSKWQHTAWVNPWVNGNKLTTRKASLTDAALSFSRDFATNSTVNSCKLFIGSNEVFNGVEGGQSFYTIAPGKTVTFEIDVPPIWGWFTVLIEDNTTHEELFFQDTGIYAVYYWTVISGHSYHISLTAS
ncbi:MAG TPA: hypothetical protein VF008_02970 [Niastella sp.]